MLVAGGLGLMLCADSRPGLEMVETAFLAGLLIISGASTVFSMCLSPSFKSVLPKPAFGTMMSAYKASVDLGKIPGPRWSNYAQQTVDSEYLAYVPLILAFAIVAIFTFAFRSFLTAPYKTPSKAGDVALTPSDPPPRARPAKPVDVTPEDVALVSDVASNSPQPEA